MWAVTGWVIATWLRVTLGLTAAVVASWLALGAHSGAFWLICLAAGLAELYLSRQLLREWPTKPASAAGGGPDGPTTSPRTTGT